jgi:Ca-activated chloride channel homolog
VNVFSGCLRKRLLLPACAGAVLCICCLAFSAYSDELYSKNKKANSLYQSKNYDGALKSYDNLILEFPAEQKLKMNKGSALYRLGDFDKAEEAYGQAKEIKDKKALAALYYNLGNAQFMEGERLGAQNGQQAMEKYKAALENYIKSLDVRPSDRDAKWNVQLAQKKIKQMEQQQQKQQNNKDNKQNKDNKDNKQNKDNKDQNKQDQNQQNQDKKNQDKQNQKQDQKNNNEKKKNDQQNQQQDQNKKDQEKQKPEPTPQQQKQEDMKKDEAKRIIEQFSDDDKELNKKPEKMGVAGQKKVEKDW